MPVIGVGGIFSADDAKEKFDAGAALIQLYTGYIYRGPALIGEIPGRAAFNSRLGMNRVDAPFPESRPIRAPEKTDSLESSSVPAQGDACR